MDADFLVFYRIDLRDPDTRISAESFFARLFRLFHYRGALRDRLQAEQQATEDRGPSPAPVSVSSSPTPAPRTNPEGTRWVSPQEMQTLFPDMF